MVKAERARRDSSSDKRATDSSKVPDSRLPRFASARTKQLFDFLVGSFVEDYMRKKYAQERSGWRSLVEAAHEIGLPTSAMYGKSGGQSPFVNELIRQGFVEVRVFPGERGRGGEISKLRITYEKKPVQAVVDRLVWGDVNGEEQLRPMDRLRVAVLPFTNMSPDPADEYIADGMTEELISTISRISGLRVISRTSVMQYKSALKNMEHIGRELGAGSIIEGSVRKAGGHVRVSVQLLDASEDKHLWAQSYDGELSNIFSIQSDIAQSVVSALKVTFLKGEMKRFAKVPTNDPEAYALYLKGRASLIKATLEGMEGAARYFHQATEKDPQYALAYAWYSNVEFGLSFTGMGPRVESFKKAEELAKRALALDESLADAHLMVGQGLFYQWDFKGAEVELDRALELDPNSGLGLNAKAILLRMKGRAAEAASYARKALELDPLSPDTVISAATSLLYSSQTDDAIALFKKVLAIDPESAVAQANIGVAYVQNGMLDEGIAAIRKSIKMEKGFSPGKAGDLAYALGKAGKFDEIKKILAEALEWHEETHIGAMVLASIYANLEEKDEAFEWLEKGFEEHSSYFPMVVADFAYDNLRSDPRMKALIDRLGLT
jgi:TolB-like protein/Flp pilus assembly protein TadD